MSCGPRPFAWQAHCGGFALLLLLVFAVHLITAEIRSVKVGGEFGLVDG